VLGLALLPAQTTGVTLALLAAIILLLTSLVNLTYGYRLRRSGYSTAARSDVSSLTLATPHLMDYVPVWVT
jgi:hypothetical protein